MRIDRLIGRIRETENPSALGLDTKIDYVPDALARAHTGAAEAIYAFNSALLKALSDIIPCVKIQVAYYEALGTAGMECFKRTVERAQALGYVVIADAKRGDIGSTAEAYSAAYLRDDSPFPADFLTVNPYFGTDGVSPFIADCAVSGKGIFALAKTSNPSGKEFQDVILRDGRPMHELVAEKIAEWGEYLIGKEGFSSVGAVVGATYPTQGAALRRKMPRAFFLLPGYGAQGASAEHLAACFDERGEGAVVAASRSIICAHIRRGADDFVSAAREEAIRMREEIRNALRRV
ncbi:MAG: orotidine-5'-phosphate decarboxylase [Synergistaceae bacterium]|nr:orotidine-5'-phosphate decarboxylase [Synergistaceae bacterium]